MTLQEMVREKNMTRYQLSQRSGIPWATLSDIWTGKTRLERCSGGTLVKLSGTLGITVEELIALDVETSMPPDDLKAEKPYFEVNLPQDLEKALREYIQGEQDHSQYLGKRGEVVAPLRPAGTVIIDGERVDVVSFGDYIMPGALVEIVKVEGNKLFVQEVKTN